MKIIALDIGNVHTGVAYADDGAIIAVPYLTVPTHKLLEWLTELCTKEPITTIIVGYPKTLRGTHSAQTEATIARKKQLEQAIPSVLWILYDERLSSKQAQSIMRENKNRKRKDHEIAAAIILQTYLDSLIY